MNQLSQIVNINETIEEIKEVERRISKEISPFAMDYIYLLAPERNEQIKLSTPLTTGQTDLLKKYNNLCLDYFKYIDVPIESLSTDTFESFLEIQRSVYLVRFVEARKLFVEYSLFSIPTKESRMLSSQLSPNLEPAVSLEVKVDQAFIVNDDGSLNFKKTQLKEKDSNLLRSVFSSYANLTYMTFKSIRDLHNITTRAFLINMNQEMLIRLMEIVLQKLFVESNKLVYNYIDKGYPTKEAVNNVKSLLEMSSNKSGVDLPEQFRNVREEIDQTISNNLSNHIKLESKYITELKSEIYELIIHYIKTGRLVSDAFYEIKFIEFDDLKDDYPNMHNVLELYLYDDFHEISTHAVEAYDIDFSRDFKKILFQLVTNGNTNPNLTLEDYLNRV